MTVEVTIDELIDALRATGLPGTAKIRVEHIFDFKNGINMELFSTVDSINGFAVLKLDNDTNDRKE
jgi:hypothetical protein